MPHNAHPLPNFEVDISYDRREQRFQYHLSEMIPSDQRVLVVIELEKHWAVRDESVNIHNDHRTVCAALDSSSRAVHADIIRLIVARANIYKQDRVVTVRSRIDGFYRYVPLDEFIR